MFVPSKASPRGYLPTGYVRTIAPVSAKGFLTVPLEKLVAQMLVPSKRRHWGHFQPGSTEECLPGLKQIPPTLPLLP
jgi:hypothetical protein